MHLSKLNVDIEMIMFAVNGHKSASVAFIEIPTGDCSILIETAPLTATDAHGA